MQSKSRVILSNELAADIYRHKLDVISPNSFESCFRPACSKMRGESAKLAKKFGVSAKAVRDIWNHKSWIKATNHLWPRNFDIAHCQVSSVFEVMRSNI